MEVGRAIDPSSGRRRVPRLYGSMRGRPETAPLPIQWDFAMCSGLFRLSDVLPDKVTPSVRCSWVFQRA